jgi:hypothetical protein
MRGAWAVPAAVVTLLGVVAGSYAIHRGPTPKAAPVGTSVPAGAHGSNATRRPPPLPTTTTTTTPHPVAGLPWAPLGTPVDGRPAMQAALLSTPVSATAATPAAATAAIVWIDRTLVSAQLVPGRQVPGGVGWDPLGEVPVAERPALVGAFNGGFKFTDSRGGFYAQGRTAYPLVAGAASLVIHADGTAAVGVWGRDATMDPTVVGVRQNLVLLVDDGALTDVAARPYPYWGFSPNRSQAVWRSAVGVDAQGNLVYAAAANITPPELADLMVRAGCVRAMQLDINRGVVTFNTYAATATRVQGTRLLATMAGTGDRYLTPDSRDFVALYGR